jgi:hypothetical protein
MLKPNPLNSLWIGLKILTGVIAQFLGMILLVGSLVWLGTPLGLWCLAVGLFSYFFSKDLEKTMAREERAQEDDDDEGPDLPLGTV